MSELKERIENKFKQQIDQHVYNICDSKLSFEIEEEIDNLVSFRASWIETYFSESFLNDCEETENIEEIQEILIDILDESLTEEFEERQEMELNNYREIGTI